MLQEEEVLNAIAMILDMTQLVTVVHFGYVFRDAAQQFKKWFLKERGVSNANLELQCWKQMEENINESFYM